VLNDILNDAIPPLYTKIYVKIRQGNALRVEETLKE